MNKEELSCLKIGNKEFYYDHGWVKSSKINDDVNLSHDKVFNQKISDYKEYYNILEDDEYMFSEMKIDSISYRFKGLNELVNKARFTFPTHVCGLTARQFLIRFMDDQFGIPHLKRMPLDSVFKNEEGFIVQKDNEQYDLSSLMKYEEYISSLGVKKQIFTYILLLHDLYNVFGASPEKYIKLHFFGLMSQCSMLMKQQHLIFPNLILIGPNTVSKTSVAKLITNYNLFEMNVPLMGHFSSGHFSSQARIFRGLRQPSGCFVLDEGETFMEYNNELMKLMVSDYEVRRPLDMNGEERGVDYCFGYMITTRNSDFQDDLDDGVDRRYEILRFSMSEKPKKDQIKEYNHLMEVNDLKEVFKPISKLFVGFWIENIKDYTEKRPYDLIIKFMKSWTDKDYFLEFVDAFREENKHDLSEHDLEAKIASFKEAREWLIHGLLFNKDLIVKKSQNTEYKEKSWVDFLNLVRDDYNRYQEVKHVENTIDTFKDFLNSNRVSYLMYNLVKEHEFILVKAGYPKSKINMSCSSLSNKLNELGFNTEYKSYMVYNGTVRGFRIPFNVLWDELKPGWE
ncbi:MAG: hypothetical protein LBC39_02745 [Methanobrevibacter sp.]|jgi:hypothetical protein|nr:hypothetical protein [Candidatus Methanovirga aequatorialis]